MPTSIQEKINVKDILSNNTCCGCSACANICPVNAITIVQDQEGFYKARIDEEKCTSCGLCSKICPVKNNEFNNYQTPKTYAAMAQDDLRLKSSSGGAFTIIAAEILKRGGLVCGAAFNKDFKVEHIIVDNEVDLEKLRRSKYVQSFISQTLYKQIKTFLEEGKTLLFTGVPCQVAGLLNYLGKNYQNLYTIDLICAYAPPAKAFDIYLQENFDRTKLESITFRSKKQADWAKSIQQLEFKMTDKSIIYDKNYMTPYLNRLFKGTHCENCQFKKFPRPADFTIGDFWKIEKYTKDMNDRKGTSAILLNTEKAQNLFDLLKPKFQTLKEMPTESAGWQIDVKNKIYKTPACKNFFQNIDKKPYNKNIKEAAKETNVGIINWWFVNNRGAILTNYALNEMVKSLGFNALTINYISPFERKNFENSFASDFADKYITRTRWINTLNDLKTLNKDLGTIICGSDQIFRYYPCKAHDMIFYLNWADANVNKLISYSASFAVNKFNAPENQTTIVKHYLKRFDNHSVREYDGVDLMKNTFGINCEQVLDPVFCIDKQKYIDMAQKSTDKPQQDFIAYYIMHPSQENMEILNYVKNKLKIEKLVALNPPMSIENWLWYVQNAKFIVTDSFHGTCFSLIFNKDFVAIPTEKEYPSRFLSLEQLSGISTRFLYKKQDIYKTDSWLDRIDWSECNKKIASEVQRSIKWLENALTSEKTHYLTEEQQMFDAILDHCEQKINEKFVQIPTQKPRKKFKIKEFAQNIFCCKNVYSDAKKFKVITILGLKIKFGRKLK